MIQRELQPGAWEDQAGSSDLDPNPGFLAAEPDEPGRQPETTPTRVKDVVVGILKSGGQHEL